MNAIKKLMNKIMMTCKENSGKLKKIATLKHTVYI